MKKEIVLKFDVSDMDDSQVAILNAMKAGMKMDSADLRRFSGCWVAMEGVGMGGIDSIIQSGGVAAILQSNEMIHGLLVALSNEPLETVAMRQSLVRDFLASSGKRVAIEGE